MTEKELIELIENELPQDLSPEQVALLREHMRRSPALRDALLMELRLEQGLATRLSPVMSDPEALMRELERLAAERSRGRWVWLASIVGLLLLVSGGLAALYWQRVGGGGQALVKAEPKAGETARLPVEVAGTGDASGVGPGAKRPTVAGAGKELPQGVPAPRQPEAAPIQPAALPPEPEPAWRLYDDPSVRGDERWPEKLKGMLRPREGAAPRQAHDNPVHYALDGLYEMTPPDGQGRTLRLGLEDPQRLAMWFWHGDRGVLVELAENRMLRAFTTQRERPRDVDARSAGLPKGLPAQFQRQRVLIRVDEKIDFPWGEGGPGDGVGPSQFAVRWSGRLVAPRGGKYRLFAVTDDGVQLDIDGKRVIDAWRDRATEESAAEVELTPGEHELVMLYFQGGGGAFAQLLWEGPGIPKQVVPAENLRCVHEGRQRSGLLGAYVFGEESGVVRRPALIQVGDDGGAYQRVHRLGVIDLRYQDGQVVIARGGTPLLTAPLPGEPTEALLEFRGEVRTADLLRLAPLRWEPTREDPAGVKELRPADMDWTSEHEHMLKGVTLTRNADGSVSFERREKEGHYWIGTDVPTTPGTVVTLALRDTSPGGGFFIGSPDHAHGNHFFRSPWQGASVLSRDLGNADDNRRRFEAGLRWDERLWVRVHQGLDHLRVQISSDGSRFADLETWASDPRMPIRDRLRWGLTGYWKPGEHRVTVESVQVDRSGVWVLEALADPLLVARVPVLPPEDPMPEKRRKEWEGLLEEWVSARPGEVSAEGWTRACYVAAMLRPAPPMVKKVAALELMELLEESGESTDASLAFLKRLPSLALMDWEPQKSPLSWPVIARMFDRLALRAWARGERDRLGAMLQAWYALDLGRSGERYHWQLTVPPVLGRLYLYHLHHQRDWALLRLRAMQMDYMARDTHGRFNQQETRTELVDLTQWMQAEAARRLRDGPRASEFAGVGQTAHPLAVDTDRESANAVAEFLAAVEDRSFEHACAILTRQTLPEGIAPVGAEGDLYKATGVLLRQAIDEVEPLRRVLREGYGAVGELRLRQGLERGDLDAVEAVAVQFHSTAAAPKALGVLADRDLSMGNFFTAAARYQQLVSGLDPVRASQAMARRRLALALAGERVEEVALGAGGLALSDRSVPEAEFNALVDSLLASRTGVDQTAAVTQAPAPGPSARAYAERVGDLELTQYKEQRHKQLPPRAGVSVAVWRGVPWLLVHQRGQVSAFNLKEKRQAWGWRHGGSERDVAGIVPARPLVLGGRFIVPIRVGDEVQLRCGEIESGREVWKRRLGDGAIGEPVVKGHWVYALSLEGRLGNYGEVSLHRVSPETGEVVMSRRVVRVKLGGAVEHVGAPVAVDDALVFRVGNALVSCDLLGQTRWVRRLPFVPPDVDESLWLEHEMGPLVVSGGLVIASCPGSPEVQAVGVANGALKWSRLEPDLAGVVGASGDRLVLATGDRVLAVSLSGGETLWTRTITADPSSLALAKGDRLLAITLDEVSKSPLPPGMEYRRYGLKDNPGSRSLRRGVREACWMRLTDGSIERTLPLESIDRGLSVVRLVRGWSQGVVSLGDVDLKARRARVLLWRWEGEQP